MTRDRKAARSTIDPRCDGERRRRHANLRRRAFMIAFHRANALPDGRSAIAVRGGKASWQKRAAAHPGGERGLALELALKRHYADLGETNDGGSA